MDEDLKAFLDEVGKHVAPKKKGTLFSLGGRGYYENPTSDLLAFFMRPDEHHGLKELFLTTYLECMKLAPSSFDFKGVEIKREVTTIDRKFIDIQICGSNWCLIIENKINHWEANPFPSYEKHAKLLGKDKILFSVLSPSGKISDEGKNEHWDGVSYQKYCEAIRRKMPELFTYRSLNKWHLFAGEFILHLEEEIYNYYSPMKTEEVTFVENHSKQIADAIKLKEEYQRFICSKLKRTLAEHCNLGDEITVWPKTWDDHIFVFFCTSSRWAGSEIVLFKHDGEGGEFSLRIYLKVEEQRLSDAKRDLSSDMHYGDPEGSYHLFTSRNRYESVDKATPELLKLAAYAHNIRQLGREYI